ncbi:MAG: FAD-binding protein [Clostridia bacterium]|nr:FAD-binding protein [Clostridia bacterium]
MKMTSYTVGGRILPMIEVHTAVIGTGCAGFNAADSLYTLGVQDIVILTEGVNMGTSRNTGSDKQTYYKLTLSGGGSDSVREMAQTLFEGGGMDGDTALCEAAGSVKGFMKLACLGVPFPTDAFGEYIGYKTDHDPRTRATSAGPLTSKFMTEALERAVREKGIQILDGWQAIRVLNDGERVTGLLCVDNLTGEYRLVKCRNVILATGCPAGIYSASVYPESQTGSTGLAVEAGAACANFAEWQYGLASIDFRWNVSGTYQQVLPRYISVDDEGVEREFLADALGEARALDMTFLKGYQWPFDVRKRDGSSVVDMLVHRETEAGRKVYMDFRREPRGLESGDFSILGEETRQYLEASHAMMATPIARLLHMNPAAVELYRSHGIDLEREPLRVAVCAQHHNGGVAVDAGWQSSVRGLYVCGEAAGTLGVYRPGGSALNATQVGSLRAAESIAYDRDEAVGDFRKSCLCIPALLEMCGECLHKGERGSWAENRLRRQALMTRVCAHLRDREGIAAAIAQLEGELAAFWETETVSDVREYAQLWKNYDLLLAQLALLHTAAYTASHFGSRGAALVVGDEPEDPETGNVQTQTVYQNGVFTVSARSVRPIPQPDEWFENVWREYRERTGK